MTGSEQTGAPLLSRRWEAAACPAPGRDEGRPPTDDAGGLSLELFMAELAEIVPNKPILPESDLIDDLGFDALAFNRLAMLLYERYGMAGPPSASMRSEESLTVEGFFRNCVLDVLRCGPEERAGALGARR